MKQFLMSLGIAFALVLAGCGGGGGGSVKVERTASDTGTGSSGGDNTGGDNTGGDTGNNVNFDLNSNVYMPLYSNPTWHYDITDTPVVLGESITLADTAIRPLVRGNERTEYFNSVPDAVTFGGMKIKVIDGDTPGYLDIRLDSFPTLLASGSKYSLNSAASIALYGVSGVSETPVKFSVTGTATRLGDKLISTAGYGQLPATGVRVTVKLGDGSLAWLAFAAYIKNTYPFLSFIFDPITTDLWFSPGVGIIQRQEGDLTYTLTQAEGISAPLVFHYAQGTALSAIAPEQIQIDNEILTDNSWTAEINYRSATRNWLDVSFDSTGSWRASIVTANLAKGLYPAVVRFTKGDVHKDVVVSMLVQ